MQCLFDLALGCDNSGIDELLSNIHPLRQKAVINIRRGISSFPSVSRLWIFGSSLTEKCTQWSDIDYCVEGVSSDKLPKLRKFLESCDPNEASVDLLRLEDLPKDYQIYAAVVEEGVVIYELLHEERAVQLRSGAVVSAKDE